MREWQPMAALRLGTVLAHPDDETFGTGGTLIRAVRRGGDVHSLCLTRGEAGWAGDPESPITTREKLGELRAEEIREAGRRMGLASVTVRDWGDGKLADAAPRAVEDDILGWLRDVRPDVLITWGPDGGYKHPDHIAAGERCIAALERAGDAMPKRVYRFVIHERNWRVMRDNMPEWVSLLDTLVPWRDDQLGAVIELTKDELERKWHAMQAHQSQLPDLRNWEKLMRVDSDGLRTEAYLRHRPAQGGVLERDIL